ncbi:MAG: signal peptidase I [Planctomycetes bacterium]|nr:signal peptidase I [Planctomycetota bacterium]
MEEIPMDVPPELAGAVGMFAAGAVLVLLVICLVFWVLGALCMALIAKKAGKPFGTSFVMSLIPIVQYIVWLQIANKPMWWIILCLIPLVNIVVFIIIWMAIAEALGRPGWWGIVIVLVPVVNIVLFLILAFSTPPNKKAA